jgi:hypothetical protein
MTKIEEYKWKCTICKERKIEKDKEDERKTWDAHWSHTFDCLICNECYEKEYKEIKEKVFKLFDREKHDFYIDTLIEEGPDLDFIIWISTYIKYTFDQNVSDAHMALDKLRDNLNWWLVKKIREYVFKKIIKEEIK